MLKELLVGLSAYLPRFVMHGGDGTPYLSRFKLYEGPPNGYRLFLHQFHRGDEDREVHNHPWSWAVSLILVGGYNEQRVVEGMHLHDTVGGKYLVDGLRLETLTFRPGEFNFIDTDTYHRVTLPDGEAWSLILTGPKTASWGFVDLVNWKYTPWKSFIAAKGLEVKDGPGRWEAPRATVRRTIVNAIFDRLDAWTEQFEVTP